MPDRDRCASCARTLAWGRFEATFELPNGRLRHVLDVPGCLCTSCSVFYVDERLIALAGLAGARCLAAIGSERAAAIRVSATPSG